MKINKTRVIAAVSAVTLAAIAWRRNTIQESIAELSWRASAVLSFVLAWAGEGASSSMGYLDKHSSGVVALCTIIGLGFSTYFQMRNNKKN